MDIELIKNKFSNEERKPCCNKKFLKKLVMSKCILNSPDTWQIRNLIEIINDRELDNSQKEELLVSAKEAYKEERNNYKKFIDSLFGEEKKESSVTADEGNVPDGTTADQGDTSGDATANYGGEE